MQHIVWKLILATLGFLLIVVTLPLVVELLMLTSAALLPRRRVASVEADSVPVRKLTVLIPCHNEELHIARCLQSVLLSGGEGVDVLLIAHNCTDGTVVNAEAFPEVRIVSFNDEARRGKGFALEEGFRLAFTEGNSDAALIIDADSVVSLNLIPMVLKQLTQNAVLQCNYEVNNPDAGWRTRVLYLAMQAMNLVRPKGRDRLSLSCGIFGNGFALRKEVLAKAAYNAYSLVEDLEFHLALVGEGYRVRFIDNATVRGEMPAEGSAAATQRARWEGGRLRMLRKWGWKLVLKVLSGKTEFAEPLLDLLSIPLAFAVLALLALLFVPGLFFKSYVACAFVVIVYHLWTAARIGPDFHASLKALLFVPFYVAWKLTMLTPILRASHDGAEWIRTRRGTTRH